MRFLPILLGSLAAIAASTSVALAQSHARVFNVEIGIPVSELPADEWVDPACGTNGGPPSIVLKGFEDFARCPVEKQTGLREIWFIYDDEWEYIARAYRDPVEIRSYSDNVFFAQPVITSLMVDDQGLVQGYRMITDPRAPNDVRTGAYLLQPVFRDLYGDAEWQCTDLPREDREEAIQGLFVKSECVGVTDEIYARAYGSYLYKPGQDLMQSNRRLTQAASEFESTARLDVYSRDAVKDAPCCQAFASR